MAGNGRGIFPKYNMPLSSMPHTYLPINQAPHIDFTISRGWILVVSRGSLGRLKKG